MIRLNEPEEEDPLVPWPPPGGLPMGEDPFAPVPDEPRLLLADETPRAEGWKLTRERAVYLSIILHLILALLFLIMPPSKPRPLAETPDPLGLIKLLSPEPPEPPIPVQFFPAPGAPAKAPGRNPLPSDANRIAHGGDPKRPKAEVPRAVAQPGIRDLDAGKRGEKPQQVAQARPKGAEPQAAGKPDDTPLRENAAVSPLSQPRGNDGTSDRPAKKLAGIPQTALAGLTSEQAAQAAREAAGDEGGGYEKEGGFVDSGPLSFDTVGYEWGPYAAEMIRKIKRNWEIPSLAHYGMKGRVTIRFFILKDGHVEGEQILSSSGVPPFDQAAFQAIAHSSAFRPLPADLGHDREGVTVTFFYNLSPDDDGARPQPARSRGSH